NVTVQLPVPLVMVMKAELLPPPEQEPDAAMTTTLPEPPPVAATLNIVPYTALIGALCVTMMVCPLRILSGSYISALAVGTVIVTPVFPPVTSTRPSVSSVAVCAWRAVLIDGADPAPLAGVQLLLVGS